MSNWEPIPGGPWETIFRLPPLPPIVTKNDTLEDNNDDIDE